MTSTIKRAFEAELVRRFKRIRSLIHETVVENDALRLGEEPRPFTLQTGPIDRFPFPTDAKKADAFMEWLNAAADEDILGITEGGAPGDWMQTYVRSSYGRGVEYAEGLLREAGVSIPEEVLSTTFNAPIHAHKLEILYQRTFRELQGIDAAMGQAISRELTQGMVEGINPNEMGRRLTDRVDKIGIHRARLLARTEVQRAHAEATLTRYEQAGVREVVGVVEFSTAGDERVCDQCAFLDASRYTIEEARGIIPVHPQCRCAWIPVSKP